MSSSNLSSEWADLPLDPRILEALADLRWAQPTTVQSACIPLALKGRDLSIQSRTGSGKSGAFFIPLIQRIITEREKGKQVKRSSSNNSNPVGLIIVPSVELCAQMVEVGQEIAKYVKPRLMIEDLSTGGAITNSRIHAAHVVVSTAAALAKACRSGAVHAETFAALRYLVVDEADMVVSMAELSLRTVQSVLPSTMQAILCSATLTEGVAMIKGQLLHNPTNIVLTSEDVKDDDDDKAEDASDASKSGPIAESHVRVKEHVDDNLHQHYLVATDECHRHTLLYALYRLSLMEGKTLIFVDQDETTYSLQHFLEQMGIATLVYDANLPMNIRMDTLRRFQHGSTATLVCTDGTLESAEQLQMSMDGTEGEEENEHAGQGGRKRRRGGGSTSSSSSAAPSALHRGVDFSHVRNVILFDGLHASSQLSLSRYTHRIGRAGRAGEEGLSIVFFTVPQAKKNIHLLRSYCESRRTHLTPFKQMQRAEASRLQYRVDTALGNVTRASTRKLRVATVAAELSRSSYLANHMSQKDTDALHRIIKRSAKKVKVEQNLLEVPTYMRLNAADNVRSYTQRVRSDQTRDQAFKKAVRKAPVDPLKAVASKLRNARGKKPSK